jgi:osmotically-inducible protein OsmY
MKTAAALLLAMMAFGQTRPAKPVAPAAGKAASDDRHIEQAIRARFAKSKIAADHFEVRVQGGVATIEGRTDVIQHKGTATRLAKAAGAVRVVNRIEISQAAREKASASLAKGRRRAQLKRTERPANR